MQAGNPPDDAFTALALRLSEAAEDILRAHYRRPVEVVRKEDHSPVTLADRAAEAAMRQLIAQAFPEHGIIGEEFGNLREDAPYQWVLDPIDGTRSFLGGYPLFTTLIALVHARRPVLGIISQPVLRERWTGVAGSRTTLNGKPAAVRGCARLAEAVAATTSAEYFTPAQRAKFHTLKGACAHMVAGGDAYAYAMLASGQMDVVVDAGLKPFDYCALAPVIEGAGGVISDWDGRPVTLDGDGRILAAANAALHAEALALLA